MFSEFFKKLSNFFSLRNLICLSTVFSLFLQPFAQVMAFENNPSNNVGNRYRRDTANIKQVRIEHNIDLNVPVLDDMMIRDINLNGTWRAHRNPMFENLKLKDIIHLFGTHIPWNTNIPKVTVHYSNIPDSFDARQKWGSCIHPIRNQAQCGSCWAFGATEALSDRFCIKGEDVILSPQDLVSCDTTDMGCDGGYLENAWNFMGSHGVCSEQCLPYASGTGNVPTCTDKCVDGTEKKEYKCDPSSIKTPSDVESIQTEIMTNGPIEVAFNVYQDFMSYHSGVYTHNSGKLLGGHAVKMIGWGIDNDIPYWICANSWDTTWGAIGGFFWIKRGTDECGIESNTICALPIVSEEVKNDEECLLCKFVVSEAEKLLTSNHTEQEIEKLLEKVCDKLPGKYSKECNVLIDTYLPTLLELLVGKESADVICGQIGMCVSKRYGGDVKCELCSYIFEELEKLLAENKTEEAIIDGLDKVCGYIPSSIKSYCDELVKDSIPFLIQLLENEQSPKTICTEIGECSVNMVKNTKSNNTGKCFQIDIINLLVDIIQNCIDGNGNACNNSIHKCADYTKSDCCNCLFGYFKDECLAMKA